LRLTDGVLAMVLVIGNGFLAQTVGAQTAQPSPVLPTAPTVTQTPWPSQTLTPTETFVSTPTGTSTATAEPTQTTSDTPTDTPTLLGTDTPTPTPSATDTSTPSPTPTVTSTPGLSAFRVSPAVLPGPVTLFWENAMAVDRLHLKVFTSSFRLLKSFPLDKEPQNEKRKIGPQTMVWNGLDDRGKSLPPGTYFLFLTARMGKGTYTAKTQVKAP
jgi:hypothetical protein